MYGLTLSTPTTLTLVTVDEAMKRCRTAAPFHAAEISEAIAASTDWLQRFTNRQLTTATWDLQLDQFPCGLDPINIPRAPLASVTSITYLAAADGASTTWSSSEYRVITSTEPGYIVPAYSYFYPTTRYTAGAVTVRYVAGTAVASVPAFLKQFVISDVVATFEGRSSEFRANPQVLAALETYRVADDFLKYEREPELAYE